MAFHALSRAQASRGTPIPQPRERPLPVEPVADSARPGAAPAVGSRRSEGNALLTSLACLLAVALVLPWVLRMAPAEGALATVPVVLAAVGLAQGCVPRARPVQIVTFGFIFVWLGVAPVYQLSQRVLPWGDSSLLNYRDEVLGALILNGLATAALLVGFSRGTKVRNTERVVEERSAVRPEVPWLYLGGCLALTPLALAAAGGLAEMFTSRSERSAALDQGIAVSASGGVQVGLVVLLPTALALSAAHLFLARLLPSARRGGARHVPTLTVIGFLLALLLLVVHGNFFVNTRFISAAAFGSLVVAALRPRSGRAGLAFGATILLAALVLYPLANAFRYEGFSGESGAEVFATPDFDGFQQVINSQLYVEDRGHSFGHYTLSGLLYFLPRNLWEGKATPASIDVAEHRGYGFTNLSLPLPAEMFIEFGVLGMIVVLVMVGLLLGWMDDKWLRQPTSRAALLVPYLSMAMLGALRGPLGSNGPIYLTTLGLLFVAVRGDRLASGGGERS